jgi:hypothetical protein
LWYPTVIGSRRPRLAARNSRLSTAEGILADYYQAIMAHNYQAIMAHNVAVLSLRELGYTEQQAWRMLKRARELDLNRSLPVVVEPDRRVHAGSI